MGQTAFHISGMCCGEEIAALKREVAPLVGGEVNLAFDLLNRKMTVIGNDPLDMEAIGKAVASAGMKAVPWTSACRSGVSPFGDGLWSNYGRSAMCSASGILLATGFLLHVFHQGSIPAALGGDGNRAAVSHPDVIAAYIAAGVAGAWFVAPKAFMAFRRLRPDINLLMAIAVAGAMAIGQWLEAASVAFLFSLALLLESWSVERARRAIEALLDIAPPTARFVCPVDGGIEEQPVADVPVGATVLVRPGERIPLDGVVARGVTTVNQAPITGESLPVSKAPGDLVFAGTLNGDGAFEFRSTAAAADTTLSRIIRLVEETRSNRAPTEQWVDRFARFYTPAMMILALLLALAPPLFLHGDWTTWCYEALVILVIACPCSLVISTPVSIVAGITASARNGILIKGGAYLEAPARIRAMAFDKTGTLTFGRPAVRAIIPMSGHTSDELLSNASALEFHSTHPLARAILKETDARGVSYSPAEDFQILPGEGAQGSIAGHFFWIGSHRLLDRWGHQNAEFHELTTHLEDAGHSLVIMWCDDHICGLLSIADDVRPEAKAVIESLKSLGMEKIVMITGDNPGTAAEVSSLTGVDEYRAGLLPEDKVKAIAELRERFGHVAMVGDGVNDAPALAAATVSIAMGAMGSDVAIETADIALMSDDLSRLPWLIRHSRRTLAIIKQNIFFSLCVKGVFLSLALSGIATLWGAIAADMGASLLVIFNGLRLLHQGRRPQS